MQKERTSKIISAVSILVIALFILTGVSPSLAERAYDGASAETVDGHPASYTLQKGEFPYCIARRYNVDPRQLLVINGLHAGMIFYPNLVLYMPGGMDSFPGNRTLRTHTSYTVRSGDTIGKVACYFGDVNPDEIADLNGLSSPYTLTVGTVLTIPGGATATPSSSKAQKASTPANAQQAKPTATKTPVPTAKVPAATLTPTTEGGGKAEGQPTPTMPAGTPPTATVTINPDVFGPQKTPTPAFKDNNKPNLLQAIIQMLQGVFQAIFQKRFGTPVPGTVTPGATIKTIYPTWTAISNSPATPTPEALVQLDADKMKQNKPSDLLAELNWAESSGGGAVYCDSALQSNPQFPAFPNVDIQAQPEDSADAKTAALNSNLVIRSCGWDASDEVTAVLTSPTGKTETQKVLAEKVKSIGPKAEFVFFIGHDQPAGNYTLSLTGTGGRNSSITLTFAKAAQPRIRYSAGLGSSDTYNLYGFAPNEQVRIILYHSQETTKDGKKVNNLALDGQETVVMDAQGSQVISINVKTHAFVYSELAYQPSLSPDVYFLFAISEKSGQAVAVPALALQEAKITK